MKGLGKKIKKGIKNLFLVGTAGLFLYGCPLPIPNNQKDFEAELIVSPEFGRAPLDITIQLGKNLPTTDEEMVDYIVDIDLDDNGVIDDSFYSPYPMTSFDGRVHYKLEQARKVRITGTVTDLEKKLTSKKTMLINVGEEYDYVPEESENNEKNSQELVYNGPTAFVPKTNPIVEQIYELSEKLIPEAKIKSVGRDNTEYLEQIIKNETQKEQKYDPNINKYWYFLS